MKVTAEGLTSKNIIWRRLPWIVLKVIISLLGRIPFVSSLIYWRGKRSLSHGTQDTFERATETVDYYVAELTNLKLSAKGLRVLELGAGDNLAVPMGLLSIGCEKVVTIDPVLYPVNEHEQRNLYKRILLHYNCPVPLDEISRRISRSQIAGETMPDDWRNRFDLVVSNSVIEHVDDVNGVFRQIGKVLALGGVTIHRIDLSSHGHMRIEADPLEFLMYPETVWKIVSRPGTVSRTRYCDIIASAEKAGLRVLRASPLEQLDKTHVENVRPRLAAPFKRMTTEDLSILSFSLVCGKTHL